MSILRLSTLSLTLAIVVFALGSANPSFADKPTNGHNHGGDDPEDVAEYSVTIEKMGGVEGASGSDNWRGNFGGKKNIGLNDSGPDLFDVGEFTDLSFFNMLTDLFGVDATHCFPSNFVFKIREGSVGQGRQGASRLFFLWTHIGGR